MVNYVLTRNNLHNNILTVMEENVKEQDADKRTTQRKTGDAGEDIAAAYLLKHGYKIIARNFFCKMGELDIVALSEAEKVLAFVEVKSRDSLQFGLPCEAVDKKKQRRIIHTAEYFLMSHRGMGQYRIRMDIFEVLRLKGSVYVRHLKDAFGKE